MPSYPALAGACAGAVVVVGAADVLGEVVWVTVYVGLGMVFASQVAVVAEVMGNVVGLLAALGVAGGAALWIRGALRQKRGRGPKQA